MCLWQEVIRLLNFFISVLHFLYTQLTIIFLPVFTLISTVKHSITFSISMVILWRLVIIIEDCNHFILVCKDYANIREHFFREVYKDFPNFNCLSFTQGLISILSLKLPEYLYLDVNNIVLNFLSQRKIIIFWRKVQNDLLKSIFFVFGWLKFWHIIHLESGIVFFIRLFLLDYYCYITFLQYVLVKQRVLVTKV